MAGNDPGTTGTTEFENVPCPFCGMVCDDLTVSRGPDGLKVKKGAACGRAVAGFQRKLPAAAPQINGKDVPAGDAIAEAAKLIRHSKMPIFGGLGSDVAGIRAVMSIAERAGGVVDHAYSDAQYRNYRVLQGSGWVMTTLTEARNRADLFIIVGTDVHKLHARFFDRIANPETTMFPDIAQKRTVVFLGENLDQSAAAGARVNEVVSIPIKHERIGELLDTMRALAKGAIITSDNIAGVPRAQVDNLLARCKAASYGVMVWSPTALDFPDADLTVQAVSEFVKDLNLTARFACLALGGSEGSTTAGAVCAWQSGFPLRVSFASGAPNYDAQRFSMRRMIADKDTDLLVWLASYSPDLAPPETDVPMIVLGTPGLKIKTTPKVFIPVGTPGVDHAGLLVRVDSVVSLPLQNLGRAQLPRAADVLAQIEAAL